MAEEPLRCDVLMAPHHGSRQSNSPELAAWCRPRWVVFSGDGRWNVPEVNATYQTIGGQVLHTYQSGAILVRIVAGRSRCQGSSNPDANRRSGGDSRRRCGTEEATQSATGVASYNSVVYPLYQPITMFDSIALRERSRSAPVCCM